MKFLKWMEKKSRKEQLFALVMAMVVLAGCVCVTGCGGGNDSSGDKLYESRSDEEGNGGCQWSVPGLAGCFGCESGCLSCLWAENCACGKRGGKNKSGEEEDIYGCIINYRGAGCFGCGKEPKTTGILLSNIDELGCINVFGLFSCLGFDGINCGKASDAAGAFK